MEQNTFLRDPKIYVALLITLAITVVFFPEEGKFKYNYQVGRPWVYETLLSPIDFPILTTDQELLAEKEEKASEVIPYFEYDNAVANVQIQRLSTLLGGDSVNSHIVSSIIESLYKMYSIGILPVMEEAPAGGTIVIQKDKRAQEVPVAEVYTAKKAEGYLKYDLSVRFPKYDADS